MCIVDTWLVGIFELRVCNISKSLQLPLEALRGVWMRWLLGCNNYLNRRRLLAYAWACLPEMCHQMIRDYKFRLVSFVSWNHRAGPFGTGITRLQDSIRKRVGALGPLPLLLLSGVQDQKDTTSKPEGDGIRPEVCLVFHPH